MQSNLLRFNKEQKYLIFDIETCNVNLVDIDNKPWQIGYMVATQDQIISTHCHYIRWVPLNISKEAAKITKFDANLYNDKAEDPLKVLSEFDKYLYDEQYKIVGHDILGFDIYIHNIWRKLCGVPTDYAYINKCYDTHIITKMIKMNIKPKDNDDFITFQYGVQSLYAKGVKTSLSSLGSEFKIPFDPHTLHHAENDVKLNLEIWKRLLYQIDI